MDVRGWLSYLTMHVQDIKFRRVNYSLDNVDIEAVGSPIVSNLNQHGDFHDVDHNHDPMDTKRQSRGWTTWFRVAFLVLLWYSLAVLTITTSKKIMIRLPLPFSLCCTQFVMASVLTRVYLYFTSNLKQIQSSFDSYVRQISVSYTFGFIFTNLAFSMVNANFAETVKAAEPISTVALGLIYLREEASLLTYLTLLPICSGVAISCFHDDSFHVYGFIYALLSNFCFSTRAVVTKRLNLHYVGAMDEISLFYHISRIGLLLLIPAMLWLEGRFILHQVIYEFKWDYIEILLLMLVNGIGYTIYNVTSFLVLSRTNLITHAVLNVFRRVFIILFTAYYFEVNMSAFNLLGILIAVSGVISFAYTKAKDNHSSHSSSGNNHGYGYNGSSNSNNISLSIHSSSNNNSNNSSKN